MIIATSLLSIGNMPRQNTDSLSEIRALIARQAFADLQLWAPDVYGSLETMPGIPVHLERVEMTGSGQLRIWRGTLRNVFPSKRYLVVERGAVLYRGGGFTEPELSDLAQTMNIGNSLSDSAIVGAANVLAVAADEYGAAQIIPFGQPMFPNSDRAGMIWASMQPDNWPTFRLTRHDDGSVTIVLTVLSRIDDTEVERWQAIAYALRVSNAGLFDTATRRGKEFHVRP